MGNDNYMPCDVVILTNCITLMTIYSNAYFWKVSDKYYLVYSIFLLSSTTGIILNCREKWQTNGKTCARTWHGRNWSEDLISDPVILVASTTLLETDFRHKWGNTEDCRALKLLSSAIYLFILSERVAYPTQIQRSTALRWAPINSSRSKNSTCTHTIISHVCRVFTKSHTSCYLY